MTTVVGITEQPPTYIVTREGDYYNAISDGKDGRYNFGGTLASTVINNALAGLTPGRTWKEKVLLKGNFVIDAVIQLPSYTILEIQGTLTAANGMNDSLLENSDLIGGNTEIDIYGGYLNGNKANQTAAEAYGIRFELVTTFKIIDTEIYNCYNCGCCIGNSIDGSVRGIFSHDNGVPALLTTGGDGILLLFASERILVSDCITRDNWRLGIGMDGVAQILRYCEANNCLAEGNSAGFWFEGVEYCSYNNIISRSNLELAYGVVEFGSSTGLMLGTNARYCTITGYISHSDRHGIIGAACEYITVNGATVHNNLYDGVYDNGDNMVFTGIIMINPQTSGGNYGFYIANANGVVIANCRLQKGGCALGTLYNFDGIYCIFSDNIVQGVTGQSAIIASGAASGTIDGNVYSVGLVSGGMTATDNVLVAF